MDRIELAKQIATVAHSGQKDKGGVDYIKHPEAVASLVAPYGEDYIITAWLHDVVEDTDVTLRQIRLAFGDVIADAVLSVTRIEPDNCFRVGVDCLEKEKYFTEYLPRCKKNPIGRIVKIADLTHNSLPERVQNLPEHERGVIKRYNRALLFLQEEIQSI